MVRDLSPKYERVYSATGGIVRTEKDYKPFSDFESKTFDAINEMGKPTQPTKSLRELFKLSVKSKYIHPFENILDLPPY